MADRPCACNLSITDSGTNVNVLFVLPGAQIPLCPYTAILPLPHSCVNSHLWELGGESIPKSNINLFKNCITSSSSSG